MYIHNINILTPESEDVYEGGVPYVKIFNWGTQHRGFGLVSRVRVRVGQVDRVSSAISGAVYSNWSQGHNCSICMMFSYISLYIMYIYCVVYLYILIYALEVSYLFAI